MLLRKKKPPMKGDLRIKKTFALWPKSIDMDTIAWMQFVYRVDIYLTNGWTEKIYFVELKDANAYVAKDIMDRLEKPNIKWSRK